MSFEIELEEGAYIVQIARKAVEEKLTNNIKIKVSDVPNKLLTKCGVFVTLNKVEGGLHTLRGCIGFPYPVMPLVEATIDAAISAATRDPRFHPVDFKEMKSITCEVSILTPPEIITVGSSNQYPKKVFVGNDGIIITRGQNKGLLLPQVPVEWGWDAEEFLTQCCLKARLQPDAWLLPGTQVYKFNAIIFKEKNPRGTIERIKL
jgi:uncharacterized protein (TIGR00296 family)